MPPRNDKGLPICFYCEKPLPVVTVHGRKYGLCHGQFSGLTQEDITRLEEYHRTHPPYARSSGA